MKLAEVQALFWAAIRHPTGVDDFLAEASPTVRTQFSASFVSTKALSASQRMTVYAESYFWRLSEVLHQQYRVVAWLAGPTRFHNLLTDFVLQHPSTSRDVRRFGSGFATFVQRHAIAQEIEGIEDLARVERAIVEALDSPNVATLTAEGLAQRPIESWPSMRLTAPPFVRLLETRRSYPDLYEMRRREQGPPDPVPPPDGMPHYVLVSRQGIDVFHRSVTAPEARALAAMLAGASFDRICAAAASLDAQDAVGPQQIVAWLQRWLAAELICGIQSV